MIKNFFRVITVKRVAWGVGILAILFLVFGLGILVGYAKARFSYQWGENYDRNFGGPHHGIFGFFSAPAFMNAHGTFGSVLSVNTASSTIAINGKDNIEKIISISSSTQIRIGRTSAALTDIKVSDEVIVIGHPDSLGEIEARLVRVLRAMQ